MKVAFVLYSQVIVNLSSSRFVKHMSYFEGFFFFFSADILMFMQMKLLECWVGMERQHLKAITAIKECLHSVVCRVPLLEGAKVRT